MKKHLCITQQYQRIKMSQFSKLKTIDTLFPKELRGSMKLDTPQDRAKHFNELWDDWRETEIELPRGDTTMVSTRYEYIDAKNIVRNFCGKYELAEFWDYQLRQNCIRFKDQQNALLFKLSL